MLSHSPAAWLPQQQSLCQPAGWWGVPENSRGWAGRRGYRSFIKQVSDPGLKTESVFYGASGQSKRTDLKDLGRHLEDEPGSAAWSGSEAPPRAPTLPAPVCSLG